MVSLTLPTDAHWHCRFRSRAPRHQCRMLARVAFAALLAVAATACTDSAAPDSTQLAPSGTAAETSAVDPTPIDLPERDGPRRETTGSVPHIQIDATPVAALDAELRRRAFALPGIADLPSDRSLPGARGFAFADDVDLARPDVIAGSREFAHIHPDGSLHVWLPLDLAQEVHDTKWGELHPWVSRDGFWDGVVMLYTPETAEELEVAWLVVVEAFNFVTGQDVAPDDFT